MGVDKEIIKAGDGASFPPKGCTVQGKQILSFIFAKYLSF